MEELSHNKWFFLFISFAFEDVIMAASLHAMWLNTRDVQLTIFFGQCKQS